MNKALLSLYESKLPELNQQIEQCTEQYGWKEVSQPFLMKVEEEYIVAPTKILFVGRETCGWESKHGLNSPSDLMELYHEVSFQENPRSSPFWWFREEFSQAFGIGKNFMRATLWTNLSKIDVKKKKPTGKRFDHLLQEFINMLTTEIAIVNPDVVIITTTDGFYNWHINNYNWLEDKPFSDQVKTILTREKNSNYSIDRLSAQGRLPKHTYLICHPNAMQRQGVYETKSNDFIHTIWNAYNGESWL